MSAAEYIQAAQAAERAENPDEAIELYGQVLRHFKNTPAAGTARQALKRLGASALVPPDPGTRVTGVDIPFTDLVGLLIKLALASIPAMIIVTIIMIGFSALIGLFFGALPFP